MAVRALQCFPGCQVRDAEMSPIAALGEAAISPFNPLHWVRTMATLARAYSLDVCWIGGRAALTAIHQGRQLL